MGSIGWWIAAAVVVVGVMRFFRWRRDRRARAAMEETVGALLFILDPDDMQPTMPGTLGIRRGDMEISVELVAFAERWLAPATEAAAFEQADRYLAGIIRRARPGYAEEMRAQLLATLEALAPDVEIRDERGGLVAMLEDGRTLRYEVDYTLVDMWGLDESDREAQMRVMIERDLGVAASSPAPSPRVIATPFGRTRGTSTRTDHTYVPARVH